MNRIMLSVYIDKLSFDLKTFTFLKNFHALLHWLGPPVQCWIVDIFFMFPISEEKLVMTVEGIWGAIDIINHNREVLFYSWFLKVYIMEQVLYFVKCFPCILRLSYDNWEF